MYQITEELIDCPYNRAHRIRPDAMQRHLYKCRRNNRSTKLATCPFNTIHHVPAPELNLHIAECPDRATFELYKYCITDGGSRKAGSPSSTTEPELIYNNEPPRTRSESPESGYHDEEPQQPSSRGKSLQDDDECWDDSAVPAYNPHEYCKSANVICKATHMKKSQKREFYQAERERLNSWRSSASSESDDGGQKGQQVATNTLAGADEWWDDEVAPVSSTQFVNKSKLEDTKQPRGHHFGKAVKRSDQKLKNDLVDISASFAQKLKINHKSK